MMRLLFTPRNFGKQVPSLNRKSGADGMPLARHRRRAQKTGHRTRVLARLKGNVQLSSRKCVRGLGVGVNELKSSARSVMRKVFEAEKRIVTTD